MTYLNTTGTNQTLKEGKTVRAALSAYEAALFKKILDNQSVEKAQVQFANDSGTLSDLFRISH